jgi:hypothetical protein
VQFFHADVSPPRWPFGYCLLDANCYHSVPIVITTPKSSGLSLDCNYHDRLLDPGVPVQNQKRRYSSSLTSSPLSYLHRPQVIHINSSCRNRWHINITVLVTWTLAY